MAFMRVNKKEIYHAALYLRLSRDDEDKTESDSIHNQRELLKSYIESHPDIKLYGEYSDDGYTGTNFDRPGFQKMMDLVQKNVIDCIIVKDLSRLGRNYIETGRYIDQIFPMLGVRFISINDNYDSARESNEAYEIIIPFKNLINDAYCRDISMKVRSQLDTKRKNGKFVGSFAAYGYKKDPNDVNKLIVDDKAAEVVKMIFNLRLDGYSPGRIADKLNKMGIASPLQYKRSSGTNFVCSYLSSDNPKWHHGNVKNVLTNEIYIGVLAQGKKRKVNYKVKKLQSVDEKDWIKVEGVVEPIISKEIFDRVQYIDQFDMRTAPEKETVDLFSGLVKCADCGQNMIRHVTHTGRKDHIYYECSSTKYGQCSYHRINVKTLEKAVREIVQNQIELVLDFDRLGRAMDHQPLETRRIKVIDEQIANLDKEEARYRGLKKKLFENYHDGIIDQEDYDELTVSYNNKISQIEETRVSLTEKKENILSEPLLPSDWISEVRNFGKVEKLTRKALVMMVDQIIIHSRYEIEVKFHYGDEIMALAELLGKEAGCQKGVIAV